MTSGTSQLQKLAQAGALLFAEREALEEAGIKGKADRKAVGYYTYANYLDDGRIAPCMVEVFAVRVDKIVKKYREQGKRERRWVSFTKAQNLVDEPELRSLILKVGTSLQARL